MYLVGNPMSRNMGSLEQLLKWFSCTSSIGSQKNYVSKVSRVVCNTRFGMGNCPNCNGHASAFSLDIYQCERNGSHVFCNTCAHYAKVRRPFRPEYPYGSGEAIAAALRAAASNDDGIRYRITTEPICPICNSSAQLLRIEPGWS